MNREGSCIVQRDLTILLEKNHPGYEPARERLAIFAELVKSPAYYHTYRVTPLSLWNAAAAGMTAEEILEELRGLSRWELPGGVDEEIRMWVSRFGSLKLYRAEEPGRLCLEYVGGKEGLMTRLLKEKALAPYKLEPGNEYRCFLPQVWRGALKQSLARLGYPVLDEVGYHHGQSLPMALRDVTESGKSFVLRTYQKAGVDAFACGGDGGGSGVLVLPCGAGKTVIGLAAMAHFQSETLILTSNVTSVRQWIAEIRDKTTLPEGAVGEYSGEKKQVCPVTVSTYQILTHRSRKEDEFKHMSLFNQRDWGLIIYDEVHLLPAPVFRATADIQATRRLGLTATLVREDGCERDVFSLIGPKRYEVPWKALEERGFIAQVECREVRVSLPDSIRERYLSAEGREKYRIAAENPRKTEMVLKLVNRHAGRQILIIGQYLDQLREVAAALRVPLISGSMPQEERGQWFARFREGKIPVLAVSKVANFAVDLPDASVAIQISGSYGSRQEEAQRLGRILRPKQDGGGAYFYTLVSEETREQDFALRRQLFLIEQGYEYAVTGERGEGA
ncbi:MULTISPECIES: DNA repair helicase XPB [Paenibacillus]|uniref:DNA repair helicase XPB n=1 Tax=Paenibacillus TaxID=44249 RepID=UPI002FE25318